MTAGGSGRRAHSREEMALRPAGRGAALAAWAVLGVLLLAVLVGAATFDPRRWPSPVGDEATYLMAAQSLAWDGDLRYSLADLERFRERRGADPDGLILQSADGGKTLLYAKPLWYPLYLAPFVRIAGAHGPALANAFLLVGAALIGAWAARAAAGAAAPIWSAVFLFASVAFAQVFWVHADLFQMCVIALALAIAVARSDAARSWRRFVVVGLLLGMATALRPVYAALAVAVAVTTGGWRRCAAVLAGLVAVAAVTVGVDYASRGAWTSYGAERQGFYGYTGFPGEPGARSWEEGVAGGLSASWVDGDVMPSKLDLRLQAHNVVYLVLGRHVGLLPYFLPLALGLAALRRTRFAGLLLLGVAATVVALSLLRPYNFWGGGGALANRYFLPVYPVFWFLACAPAGPRSRPNAAASGERVGPLPPVLAWTLPLVVTALAAPALWPLWQAPRQFLRALDGGYGYVSPLVQRLLPYETSQKHLKPAGREDFVLEVGAGGGAALWVKPLSPRVRPLGGESGAPASELEVVAGRSPAQVLLGSPVPIGAIEVEGSATGERAGATHWRTRLALESTAVHSMWWTAEPYFLYRLDLEEVAARGRAPLTASPSWTVRVSAVAPLVP